MRFLVDENLPWDLVSMARERGFEAAWVRDILPGAKDSVILDRLRAANEILVTRDVRFANLIFNLMNAGDPLFGVVLIREQSLKAIRKGWIRYLTEWPGELEGITVVSEGRMRRHRSLRDSPNR
jgi:predicted nuclease of predicted toxin-antitoxin system